MNAKFIVVGVVIVMVVASAGAYFVMTNKDEGKVIVDTEGVPLTIMGNVNGDHTIDQADLDKLNEILGSGKTDEYPYADVNNDGAVDQKDVEALRKIVNREKTTIHVVGDNQAIVQIQYPLRNVVTILPEMLSLMTALGARSAQAGYIASTYPVEQAYMTDATHVVKLGTSRQFNKDSYEKFKDLSSGLSDKGGIGAILYMTEGGVGSYKSDFEEAGIPLLWLNVGAPIEHAKSALKLGFLLGGVFEDRGKGIYDDTMAIIKHILEKTRGVEKVDCFTLVMTTYINEKRSQYTILTELAGGNSLTDLDGTASKQLNSDSISKYDAAKYIINFRTLDLVPMSAKEVWERPTDAQLAVLKSSAAYENHVWLNNSIPIPAKLAYVAEILHPDLFEGYGHRVFQDYVDKYLTYLNENSDDGKMDVSKDIMTTVTYQMYQDALKA